MPYINRFGFVFIITAIVTNIVFLVTYLMVINGWNINSTTINTVLSSLGILANSTLLYSLYSMNTFKSGLVSKNNYVVLISSILLVIVTALMVVFHPNIPIVQNYLLVAGLFSIFIYTWVFASVFKLTKIQNKRYKPKEGEHKTTTDDIQYLLDQSHNPKATESPYQTNNAPSPSHSDL